MAEETPTPGGEFLLYQAEDGRSRIECRLRDETLWLSLNQISELFDRDKSVISKHLKNIFEEGELVRNSVVAQNSTTAADGKTYQVDHYRLEALLAVGCSARGTQFRQWATAQLRDYLTQGFIMDDERMKNPDQSVYFERVLERIRDIRSSEKVFWRKVCDIYATRSVWKTNLKNPHCGALHCRRDPPLTRPHSHRCLEVKIQLWHRNIARHGHLMLA